MACMYCVRAMQSAVLVACIAAVIVYGVALLVLKGLTEEELLGFPKGRTLVSNCEESFT